MQCTQSSMSLAGWHHTQVILISSCAFSLFSHRFKSQCHWLASHTHTHTHTGNTNFDMCIFSLFSQSFTNFEMCIFLIFTLTLHSILNTGDFHCIHPIAILTILASNPCFTYRDSMHGTTGHPQHCRYTYIYTQTRYHICCIFLEVTALYMVYMCTDCTYTLMFF